MIKVAKYLKRLNVKKEVQADLASLAYLQNQHLLTVPFENLDVMNKVYIPLAVDTFYQKIVENQRGGFCYELNGLFQWLLNQLGFASFLSGATLYRGEGAWGRPQSHAVQIVHLDQPYLVDVGFGNSARTPLPFNGETRKDVSGLYRLIQGEGGYYHKQRKEKGAWRTLYRFKNKEMKLFEFKEACHRVQTSPDSHFTQRLLVTIATETGRKTLAKNTLTITEREQVKKIEVGAKDIPELLKTEFGLN